MLEKPEEPTGVWSYELLAGEHDGAEGRQAHPRTTVCRPSLVDRRLLAVYHIVHTDAERRHAKYRFSHTMPAVLATQQDR